MRSVLALLALSLSSPALADSQHYRDVAGWEILRDDSDSTCTMAAKFTDGVTSSNLLFTFNHRLNEVRVTFGEPSAKSLELGDEREIKTIFLGPKNIDDLWGKKTFQVVKVDGISYFTRLMDDEFLIDLTKNTHLAFYYKDDILLQSYLLKGSSQGVAALRQCALAVARANPVDPFAGEKPAKLITNNRII